MNIVISHHELKAAMLFASKDETRYVLNGVLIETNPGKKPVLVSTDGRRLAVIETSADQKEDALQSAQVILHPVFTDWMTKIAKGVGDKIFPWIAMDFDPARKRVEIEFVGTHTEMQIPADKAVIEGQFPDWRKILPPRSKKREPIAEVSMVAEFMGDYAKAAKALNVASSRIQVHLVGKEQSMEVKLTDAPNFYGLLMQCKLDGGQDYQPEFLSIVKQFEVPEGDDEQEEEA